MERRIRKAKLCILAEGYEEEAYLRKILSFPNRLREKYEIVIINAKGRDKLINRYQIVFNSHIYQKIYIFGDGDNDPTYIKKTIDSIANIRGDSEEVFIYVNPVTLQIVLSHFGEVCLTKVGKKSNASEVERLTGIKNYSAREEQIKRIIDTIKYDSIESMMALLNKLPCNIYSIPSSNAFSYLNKIFRKEDL